MRTTSLGLINDRILFEACAEAEACVGDGIEAGSAMEEFDIGSTERSTEGLRMNRGDATSEFRMRN